MSSRDEPIAAQGKASSPFAYGGFVLLWTATLISNTGTWMHEVGAGWLMTTLDPEPAIVTLVQAATTLPVFCFALFAGALADRLDKRRLLITINLVLTLIISLLALLVWREAMTPTLLILITFAIGTGAAFMAPAWQAVVPQLVPRETLRSAIALNSMGINISRAIGPALAGVLIAGFGLASPFAVNVISHLAIVAALVAWRPDPKPLHSSHNSIVADMATGLRHVRYNSAMLATSVRAMGFFLFASAYWSLLPLIAHGADSGGSKLYGMLMALIGAGAVFGALLLPHLQKRISSDQTVRFGTAGTATAMLAMALSSSAATLMFAAFLGGLSWIAVLTSFNVSAQTALPDWVRARGLAVYLMVFFGAMALGSVTWGQLATLTSIPTVLLFAAAGLLIGIPLTRRFIIGQGETLDFTPASAWPLAPTFGNEDPEDRAARVTVEYRIAATDREVFLTKLRIFSKERLRDGATRWELHQNVENPEFWVENFYLSSWSEHLEQHDRVTRSDIDLQQELRALDNREDGPVVRHYLRAK
ncbi:MFS transporter [Parasedimentitalea marina]|uniref:MFS transporter n=1 Tax=Parasedimentitalea marina TaxID=2483033 RepID=A0A3T0N7A6_9RHOB|nr:MFS transporter [Parasedimentitalea marina]AZV79908.1 MFS transporter [Parasedimentitalea marina]